MIEFINSNNKDRVGSIRKSIWLTGICASAIVAYSNPALAEETFQEQDVRNSGAGNEIIVTARRREESLQSVPVSVTVATSEILQEQKIVQASDLQTLVPGLTVTASSVSQGQSGSFNIRGQGQTFGGALPSVITYFSEVPLESQGGAAFALYDIDSVQILRGPQGTLFGRNTVGGAVLITPTPAGRDLGGYLNVSAGNLDYWELKAAVNLPVTDTLAVRFAGNVVRRGDTTKNLAGHGFGNRHSDSWRVSVRWEPSASFRNDFVYTGLQANEHGDAFILSGLREGQSGALFNGGSMVPELAAQQQRGPRVVSNSQDGLGASRNVHLIANTSTIDLGGVSIKNILSYERVKVCYGSDLDGVETRQSISTCFPNMISRAAGIDPYPDVNMEQWAEELQVSGMALDDRLDYQFGGFISLSRSMGGLDTFRVSRTTFAPAAATTQINNLTINQFKDVSRGIYTQNTIRLGAERQFSLTAGLRYTWDTREGSFGRLSARYPITSTTMPTLSEFNCTLPGIGSSPMTPQTQCFGRLKRDFNGLGYTFGADWQPTDSILLYFTTRRGFKDGGFNTVIASANDPNYDRETATDYEVGAKISFDTGGVSGRFNINGFTGKYKGIQRQVTGGLPVTSIFVNAGTARVKGVEIESVLNVGEFSLSAHYAYQTGKYKGFIDRGVDVSDSQLMGLPKHSGGATLRWEHELPGSVGTLIAAGTIYATQKMPYIANNLVNYEAFVDGYHTLSGRLEWRNAMNSDIDVALWGKNLGNKEYIIGGAAQGGSSGITSYIYAEPRTYGIEATVHF